MDTPAYPPARFSRTTRASTLEGTYIFALPGGAIVSDFAVWDDVTRIPGVILERRRAEEIYQQAKLQAIDPGLLQQGERDLDEASRSAVFSAQIVPIQAFGTKRLEMEYQEDIPVERVRIACWRFRCGPTLIGRKPPRHLWIKLELDSAHALRDFQIASKHIPNADAGPHAASREGRFRRSKRGADRGFRREVRAGFKRGRPTRDPDASRSGPASAGCGRPLTRSSGHSPPRGAGTGILRSIA